MKKIIVMMLAVTVMIFSFTGCGNNNVDNETTKKDEIATEETSKKDEITTEDTSQKDEMTTEDVAQKMENTVDEKVTIAITVFSPNDNVDGLNETEVEIEELNEMFILDQLIQAKVIREGTKINHFETKVDQDKIYLIIDFNENLGDLLNAYGTSGEYVTLGSLVNTFLKAYDADYLQFTINDQIFESGHMIYDEPLGFFRF